VYFAVLRVAVVTISATAPALSVDAAKYESKDYNVHVRATVTCHMTRLRHLVPGRACHRIRVMPSGRHLINSIFYVLKKLP